MDDIKLALLGNKEAAKRLTEAGVLVPIQVWRQVGALGKLGVSKLDTNGG